MKPNDPNKKPDLNQELDSQKTPSEVDVQAASPESHSTPFEGDGDRLNYLLTAYLFDNLSEAGKKEVEDQLEADPTSREELQTFQKTLHLLEDALEVHPSSEINPEPSESSPHSATTYSFDERRRERIFQAARKQKVLAKKTAIVRFALNHPRLAWAAIIAIVAIPFSSILFMELASDSYPEFESKGEYTAFLATDEMNIPSYKYDEKGRPEGVKRFGGSDALGFEPVKKAEIFDSSKVRQMEKLSDHEVALTAESAEKVVQASPSLIEAQRRNRPVARTTPLETVTPDIPRVVELAQAPKTPPAKPAPQNLSKSASKAKRSSSSRGTSKPQKPPPPLALESLEGADEFSDKGGVKVLTLADELSDVNELESKVHAVKESYARKKNSEARNFNSPTTNPSADPSSGAPFGSGRGGEAQQNGKAEFDVELTSDSLRNSRTRSSPAKKPASRRGLNNGGKKGANIGGLAQAPQNQNSSGPAASFDEPQAELAEEEAEFIPAEKSRFGKTGRPSSPSDLNVPSGFNRPGSRIASGLSGQAGKAEFYDPKPRDQFAVKDRNFDQDNRRGSITRLGAHNLSSGETVERYAGQNKGNDARFRYSSPQALWDQAKGASRNQHWRVQQNKNPSVTFSASGPGGGVGGTGGQPLFLEGQTVGGRYEKSLAGGVQVPSRDDYYHRSKQDGKALGGDSGVARGGRRQPAQPKSGLPSFKDFDGDSSGPIVFLDSSLSSEEGVADFQASLEYGDQIKVTELNVADKVFEVNPALGDEDDDAEPDEDEYIVSANKELKKLRSDFGMEGDDFLSGPRPRRQSGAQPGSNQVGFDSNSLNGAIGVGGGSAGTYGERWGKGSLNQKLNNKLQNETTWAFPGASKESEVAKNKFLAADLNADSALDDFDFLHTTGGQQVAQGQRQGQRQGQSNQNHLHKGYKQGQSQGRGEGQKSSPGNFQYQVTGSIIPADEQKSERELEIAAVTKGLLKKALEGDKASAQTLRHLEEGKVRIPVEARHDLNTYYSKLQADQKFKEIDRFPKLWTDVLTLAGPDGVDNTPDERPLIIGGSQSNGQQDGMIIQPGQGKGSGGGSGGGALALGDPSKPSAELLIQPGQIQNYEDAVKLFGNGNFEGMVQRDYSDRYKKLSQVNPNWNRWYGASATSGKNPAIALRNPKVRYNFGTTTQGKEVHKFSGPADADREFQLKSVDKDGRPLSAAELGRELADLEERKREFRQQVEQSTLLSEESSPLVDPKSVEGKKLALREKLSKDHKLSYEEAKVPWTEPFTFPSEGTWEEVKKRQMALAQEEKLARSFQDLSVAFNSDFDVAGEIQKYSVQLQNNQQGLEQALEEQREQVKNVQAELSNLTAADTRSREEALQQVQKELVRGKTQISGGGGANLDVSNIAQSFYFEKLLNAYSTYKEKDPSLTFETFQAKPRWVPPPELGDEGLGREAFRKKYNTNPFVDTRIDKLSTFAMDVDTASFTRVKSLLDAGSLPKEDIVRVEEFVNAIPQDYPEDTSEVFTVSCDGMPSPFGPEGVDLLRVGIKSRNLKENERRNAVLTLAIDASGSMAEQEHLDLIKGAMEVLIKKLAPTDQVALVAYSDQANLILPHTPARQTERILGAMQSLQPRGGTNVEAGLDLAYRVAHDALSKKSLHRVILVSDGVANVGARDPEKILKKIRVFAKRGIYLTAIGVGSKKYDDRMLERLANEGNGNYAYVSSVKEAAQIFESNLPSTLEVLAEDAKIQVEFPPEAVSAYRLLGYENRDIKDKDFRNDKIDAAEVGPGSTVTALYEVVRQPAWSGPVGKVFIRYRDTSTRNIVERDFPIPPGMITSQIEHADDSIEFLACVAELAELLRNSYYSRDGSLGDLILRLGQLNAKIKATPRWAETMRMAQQAFQLKVKNQLANIEES